MFSKKNNVIEEITMYDIPKVTRALSLATDINKQRELMESLIDPALIQQLDDTTVESLFKKAEDTIENKIRLLIKEATGQVAIAEGSKIKLKEEFNGFPAGTEGVIKECIRFEENTFGYGWYTYDVEILKGLTFLRMYQHEFEVI